MNVLKNYFAVYFFMFFLKARPKKKERKKKQRNYLEVSISVIPLFFERTEFRIYNTIEVTAPNEGDQTAFMSVDFDIPPTRAERTNVSLCCMVTLESLEQLV